MKYVKRMRLHNGPSPSPPRWIVRTIRFGNNVWGEADHSISFTVGDAHVTTVDTNGHIMTVQSNGQTVRSVPMSAGRSKYPTMGGALKLRADHAEIPKGDHARRRRAAR